jgi:hypothetical protein
MRVALFCRDESEADYMQQRLPCTSDRWEWIVVVDVAECSLLEDVEELFHTYHKHIDEKKWEPGESNESE